MAFAIFWYIRVIKMNNKPKSLFIFFFPSFIPLLHVFICWFCEFFLAPHLSRRHCLNFSITSPLVFTPNLKMARKQYANTIQYTNSYGNAKSRK